MNIEFETQILDIKPDKIINKLRQLGAEEKNEVFQKRYVFDIECLNSVDPGKGSWIRLRQIENKSTLTYKNRGGIGISDTQEIELEVEDFDRMNEILNKLDCFTGQYYQENKRKKFYLNGVEFCLDSWPLIPTFLEIEAESEEKVHEAVNWLGLEDKEHSNYGLINIYAKYGINIHGFKELKF
jgi:adenylate cyclase class 2